MTAGIEAGSRIALTGADGWYADGAVPWLAEAWCAIDGLRSCPDAPATPRDLGDAIDRRWPSARVTLIDVADRGIGGFLVWEVGADGVAALVIRAVAVRRDWRNLGYGGEAVERLETAHAAGRLSAAVPRWNGLAIYFWLRVGYRPLRAAEDPDRHRDADHLWMVRTASSVSAGRTDP